VTPDQPAASTVSPSSGDPDEPRGLRELLRLQEADVALDRLHARKAQLEGGEEAARARGRIAELDRGVAELRQAVEEVEREQARLEHDVESMDLKRRDEEKRLYDGTVANPKELQSIRAEIENIARRKARMEDRLLELMEEGESLAERMAPVQAGAAAARDELAASMKDGAEELDRIGVSLAERSAERTTIVPSVDEDLLDLYEDLRRTKKGVGVAELRDGVCQGCHQKLSAMELDRLKRTPGVRRCDYCRRILVFA
jgi:predicted  nucleic acid-binding Zn-ribbon protein